MRCSRSAAVEHSAIESSSARRMIRGSHKTVFPRCRLFGFATIGAGRLPLVRINWHNQEMPQPHLGDLSYGLYLWHFPIIQWAISRGWLKEAPWLAAGAVFL